MLFPLGSIATCQALCGLSEQVGTPAPPRSDEASTSRLLPRQLAVSSSWRGKPKKQLLQAQKHTVDQCLGRSFSVLTDYGAQPILEGDRTGRCEKGRRSFAIQIVG